MKKEAFKKDNMLSDEEYCEMEKRGIFLYINKQYEYLKYPFGPVMIYVRKNRSCIKFDGSKVEIGKEAE